MNIFEEATRAKLRFKTTSGNATVEDLWDLSLTKLDAVAKHYNKQVKESGEESFITTTSKTNTIAKLKFDIVLHVINVKIAERDEAKQAADKKAQKEKIMRLITDKQDEELKGKTIDELQKELAAL